jgi:hypothetical protein
LTFELLQSYHWHGSSTSPIEATFTISHSISSLPHFPYFDSPDNVVHHSPTNHCFPGAALTSQNKLFDFRLKSSWQDVQQERWHGGIFLVRSATTILPLCVGFFIKISPLRFSSAGTPIHNHLSPHLPALFPLHFIHLNRLTALTSMDEDNDTTDQQFKYKLQAQFEHTDAKNPSAGNSNTTKFQLAQNQHRDTAALFVAHDEMLHTVALAEGTSVARSRYNQIQNMFMPVGFNPNPTKFD